VKSSARRILVNVALDGALAASAAPIARWIADPQGGLLHPLWFLAGGGITLLLGGVPFRLSQQYWRFSGLTDLIGVVGGSVACAGLFAALLLVTGFSLPTVTFPIVHALTLMVLLGTPRVAYRVYRGRPRGEQAGVERLLLVGAGDAANAFIRAASVDRALRVTGLIALSPRQAGRRMHNLPILGTIEEAERILARLAERGRRPDALVVAIEDLLNRPQVSLDRAGMRQFIAGRRVLVTGAGGSIGAELCRQLAALAPGLLVLLDSSEYALWQIDLELCESLPGVPRRAVIADVRDASRIAAVFEAHRPEVIFHAAALKHVPMVEANPLEGLMTNAVGTRVVADAGRASGAAAMVLISTDKAVNPTSLMGASKRIAEIYCQALDIAGRAEGGMRCVTVRFGNVLGSTGSVVPLFRRQLERGGPLTVTHPDMQRYFMTVREAVSLVLQACIIEPLQQGGIFVLDMGAPVKIVELAKQMIRLSGLGHVDITYSGLRPGEKLFEELFHGQEPPVPTGHDGLLMATPRIVPLNAAGHALNRIARACRAGELAEARAIVGALVPEFSSSPQENAA
jgi:O-antigen biosynthesis protein WbqV